MGAPGDGGGPVNSSGTRLKVTRYAGVDGFVCNLQRAVDGTVRCFPTAWAASRSFADASCSVHIVSVPECSDDSPRFATMHERTQDSACSVRKHRAFALGDALINPPNIYALHEGECVELSGLGGSFFYATEIPVGDLALATKVVEDL
jgi:hypothetical protein